MRRSLYISAARRIISFLAGSLIAVSNQISTAGEKDKIDVRQSDDAIRRELFRYTPLGSQADDVIEFVLSRLYYEGGYTSGVGVIPEPGISVELGHCCESISYFSHTSIQAEWIFDRKLKLRKIEVRRLPQEGGYDPGKNPGTQPKVRLDLHQSDKTLRQQLLKYVPIGSSLTDVFSFIQGRLYFQGGPESGMALTHKRGTGVILGHYFDKDARVQKSVRVNWVRNGQDKVRDVEILRVNSVAPLAAEE
jgi:hypothetical protein